jgi:methionyl-tRNA synthetase
MKSFYITTAIDYPNAEPHIGTAFEKVGADVQARFQRFVGRQVYFLMGNDENTQKVAKAAAKKGQDVQVYADAMAGNFRHAWRSLDITQSRFCQTSSPEHHKFCQDFLQKVFENGHIYSKHYEGLYCPECEEYKLSVVNGECPQHPGPKLQTRSEQNYFFAQSRFKEEILKLYEEKKIKVIPEYRQNELLNFVQSEKDISISRSNQGWGIPVPWDSSQVIYVWFDALLNYLSFANGNWPADVHVIGKDIVRFHGALFPAMILAYNSDPQKKGYPKIPLPHTIFSHGFVCRKTDNGLTKFSKSSGDALGPSALVQVFGSDAYRYLFMKSANFSEDAEYSFGIFAETYNADLVNKYGNLFSRVCRLAATKLDCKIPAPQNPLEGVKFAWWHRDMAAFNYRDALVTCMDVIDTTNRYLEDRKPWAEDAVDVPETIAVAAHTLKIISALLAPVMPDSSREIWQTLTYEGQPCFDMAGLEHLEEFISNKLPLTVDQKKVKEGKVNILFPRYKG